MQDWMNYDKTLRSLGPAISTLNTISNELNLPKQVLDFSLRIYQMLLARKLTQGRRREVLVGACIYLSCQGVNYPINLADLCNVCECSKKELIRQKKFIKRFIKTNEEGVSTESYINRYCFELRLKPEELTKILNTAKRVDRKLINHKPRIKAAVSIYLTLKDKISIRQLMRVTGLSRSGIYNAYKESSSL